MVKLIFAYLFFQHISVKFGIAVKEILNIYKAISNFNLTRAFENLSVDEKVELLNKTLPNIYLNYIPHKKIKCDYCQPPWMTDNIKKSLKERLN